MNTKNINGGAETMLKISFMRLRCWMALVPAALLMGCAHPINVQPKIDSLVRGADAPDRLKHRVGYYIPDASRNLEVTTPGGGGDSVRYFPYRDLEAGFRLMLTNVFEKAERLETNLTAAEMQKQGYAYLLQPVVTTNSGSTGVITWPPTNFTVDLTTQIRDANGTLLGSPRAVGSHSVSGISEMGGNFGITGQMAMQDALIKQQTMLFETLGSKGGGVIAPTAAMPTAAAPPLALSPVEERLRALRELRDKDLLTPDEYEKRRLQIINSL
jgi:hypothetical protein